MPLETASRRHAAQWLRQRHYLVKLLELTPGIAQVPSCHVRNEAVTLSVDGSWASDDG